MPDKSEYLVERSEEARRAYGDGYLAAIDYAISVAGQPADKGDAREQIIERLQRFRDGIEAIHNAG